MERNKIGLCVAVILLALNFWSSRSSIKNLTVFDDVDSKDLAIENATRPSLRSVEPTNTSEIEKDAEDVRQEDLRLGKEERVSNNSIKQDLLSQFAPELPQPHTGARDIHGNLGYVADVTRVRRWMLERYGNEGFPPLQWTPTYSTKGTDPCGKLWYSAEETLAVLKIVPNHPGVPPRDTYNTSFVPKYTKRTEEYERYDKRPPPITSRLLCAVYTYAGKHEQITAVEETWGWKCDGFFAASTETVDNATSLGYGAVNLTHAGPESYGNMWQKTRSILAYMHDHYRHEYEYFWVGGDDTFMVIENIKRWLAIVEDRYDVDKEPLYLGHYVKKPQFRFAGGGPGYILNRKALELFFEKAGNCQKNAETSAEDRYLGLCFHGIGIKVEDTADARGQQRFIGYAPGIMAQKIVRNKFFHALFQSWIDEHPQATMGPGLYSEQAFGLHWFKSPAELHHLNALLYRTCPLDSVVGKFVDANNSTNRTLG